MSRIRLLKASSYYDESLKRLYASDPLLARAPYREQHATLMGQAFGWADFWKRHLEKTGDFEVAEIVSNAMPLQRQWAAEHGMATDGAEWPRVVLAAQIKEFRPDVIFFNDFRWDAGFLQAVRRQTPGLRLLLGWDGIGVYEPRRFVGVDVVVSCAQFVIDRYRSAGFDTYLMPYGFEDTLLERLDHADPHYAVTFVGSVLLFEGGHVGRLRMLAELSRRVPVCLWLHFPVPSVLGLVRSQAYRIRRGRWQEFLDVFALLRRNRGSVFGMEMLRTLARSKVVVNTHIDSAASEAANSRLFEATGVGSCLLTDEKPNLDHFFEVGREVMSYRSPEECAEKAEHLLGHDAERRSIAAAGQQRTLRDHRLKERLQSFAAYLVDRLSR